mmetsp:Transcript_45609/g.151196  ORF Transcript_45609/g.151196 Transcript_45609/m.151196 type:complete len:361 (-) Transcript_45609:261-1343(-)
MYCSWPRSSPNSISRPRTRSIACLSSGSGRTVRGSGAEVRRRYFFSTVVLVPATVKSSSMSPPSSPPGWQPGCCGAAAHRSARARSARCSRERPDASKRLARLARLLCSSRESGRAPACVSCVSLAHPLPALRLFFLPPSCGPEGPSCSSRPEERPEEAGSQSSFLRGGRGSLSQSCLHTSTAWIVLRRCSPTTPRSRSLLHCAKARSTHARSDAGQGSPEAAGAGAGVLWVGSDAVREEPKGEAAEELQPAPLPAMLNCTFGTCACGSRATAAAPAAAALYCWDRTLASTWAAAAWSDACMFSCTADMPTPFCAAAAGCWYWFCGRCCCGCWYAFGLMACGAAPEPPITWPACCTHPPV